MKKTAEEMKNYIKSSIPSTAHVCIAVKDMDASIQFYTEILGFEVRSIVPCMGNRTCIFFQSRAGCYWQML